MNQSDLISIVIPMYNAENFIGITLESVLGQTYENIEVILVDDGSTDGTYKIAEKYQDSRISLVTGENRGASYARNLGFSMAKGEYILFFDADDRMYPDMLEILISGMKLFKADVAVGNHDVMDINGNITDFKEEPEGSRRLSTQKWQELSVLAALRPFPDTKLYKTSIIRENQISFPDARIGEDLNFYLKYLLCSKWVWQTDQVICSYRILYSSMSHKSDGEAMMEITDSFEDVDSFCKKNQASHSFFSVFINLQVSSYLYQANHWPVLPSKREKKKLLLFFYQKTKQLEQENGQYFTDSTRILLKRFYKTWRRRCFYLSPLHEVYSYLKNGNGAEKNE